MERSNTAPVQPRKWMSAGEWTARSTPEAQASGRRALRRAATQGFSRKSRMGTPSNSQSWLSLAKPA